MSSGESQEGVGPDASYQRGEDTAIPERLPAKVVVWGSTEVGGSAPLPTVPVAAVFNAAINDDG